MLKEISYEFLPQSWGNGYAFEVIRQLLMYALHELKLGRVIAETQTANVSSCRLLEKVGMKVEATLQRYGAEQALYGIDNHPGLFI
jgi:ribosomal-protein-alanine N-acetyltransferase